MSQFNKSKLSVLSRNGLITIAALAGFSALLGTTGASAEGYYVEDTAQTANFPAWDRLNIRAWPASHSKKVAQIRPGKIVHVERCIIKSGARLVQNPQGLEIWLGQRSLSANRTFRLCRSPSLVLIMPMLLGHQQ